MGSNKDMASTYLNHPCRSPAVECPTPPGEVGSWLGHGTCPPGIRKNDVICCRPTKYPNIFARAFAPIFHSKTSENAQFYVCALGAPKNGRLFCTALRKRTHFFKCWWFCPLWKNFCGRPWAGSSLLHLQWCALVANKSWLDHCSLRMIVTINAKVLNSIILN